MSIYQPSLFSNITTTASGLLSGVIGSATTALGGAATQAINGKVSGALSQTVAGNLANAAIGMAATEINKRANAAIQNLGYQVDETINQSAGKVLSALGLSNFGHQDRSDQDLHFAGGLSLNDMKQIIEETRADELSRKNFYVLQINDRSGQAPTEGSDGNRSLFNLFTTNLSFNPIEISAEQIQIGSGTMNIPTQNGLTEMTLSVYDTMTGIIKDWAKRKALYQTPSDGTVMPPYYHCFDVKVIYGTNKAYKQFYNETYTMMIAGTQSDLDRSEEALEQVSLRFVQESTFMPTWM